MIQLLKYALRWWNDINFIPKDLHPNIHDRLTKYLKEINNYWKKNTGYNRYLLRKIIIKSVTIINALITTT